MRRRLFDARGLCVLIALLIIGSFPSIAQQVSESKDQLMMNGRVLLDAQTDGFMSVDRIKRSPDGKHFIVIACGYECNDNIGFLFNADGSGKRKLTARWDYILQSKIEWSADGRKLYYFRINSSGASPVPLRPGQKYWPKPGWIEVDLKSLRKAPAINRALKPQASYAVFNVLTNDQLNVHAQPDSAAQVTGAIPSGGKDVSVTGDSVRGGSQRWAPIRYRSADGQWVTGWVNQSYLYEQSHSFQEKDFFEKPK